MNYLVVIMGWMFTVAIMLFVVLATHIFQLEQHDYHRFGHSAYLAFSRSGWGLGIIWMIWACVTGYGGKLGVQYYNLDQFIFISNHLF